LTASSYTVFTGADGVATVWFSPIAQFVEFHLRACNSSGAIIHLATVARQPDTAGYDITLKNTVSTIVRRKTGASTSVDTPGLLDCVHRPRFWITWSSSGVVSVGQHRIGTNVIMTLQDTSADVIAAVSVSTMGTVGEWQIASATGESAF
jgi:Farnesoic acid 0-methyl transferase